MKNLTKEEAINLLIKTQQQLEQIEQYIKQSDSSLTIESKIAEFGSNIHGEEIEIDNKRQNILLPLPKANTEWTLEIFEWVKNFCIKYPKTYPVHYEDNDNHKWIYVYTGNTNWI